MNRQQRLAAEKQQLLRQIQQQRLDLAANKNRWLEITAPCDDYWQKLARIRRYLVVIPPIVAILGIRHPRRLMNLARKAAGIWSALKLIRSVVQSPPRR
ncbi:MULTISPECIES: YqjK-like family protein [Dickeya]|uniref:Cell division protein FtsH n=1 Tax=Dickeya fangzhongdai TaxID=1778540 RepID=A0A2K8QHZ7_9GAMM|nr:MULTISPECIES: YqjK-like family protein [Dickeya]ATZ93091.1 cell division protein FtsH [Dickeya fangzhongdai]AYH46741.1 cell division protein FtsH [Dickeya fangzhongdai]MBO8135959.1 YqjK-like family protein [Dickeya fangzhongdai]QOH46520.1 cell division protein FtsH [Dickeya fangzhongdai]QOH50827.1 cell division protein FtsH [Dickeya fangzhongdai]